MQCEDAPAVVELCHADIGRPELSSIETVWSVVQTAYEACHDPQTLANGYVVPVEAVDGSSFPLVGSPVQFDESPTGLVRAPDHGEHTDQVLLDLGLSWDDIIELKAAGAVL